MQFYHFKGFDIPKELIEKTGRGTDSWDSISRSHIKQINRYIGISEDDNFLEIGCGVGRDAIPLLECLNENGSYIGVDVMWDAIAWCNSEVESRFINSKFFFLDIRTPDYNPDGLLRTEDITLPVAENTIDKIILQSVFTHLLPAEVEHYLREFYRVLKPSATVFASVFCMDEETRALVPTDARLSFRNVLDNGIAYVNDLNNTRRAVAYSKDGIDTLAARAKMYRVGDVNRGTWSGRSENGHGQDIVILAPNKIS